MGQLGADLGPTWSRLGANMGQHGPTWVRLGANMSQHWPSWGQLGVNLGSTWANLRPTGADMQQLGVNLGPTRANMVARGQLGVNMYLGKPEKLVFRLDGSTIFTKLYVSPWTRFGRPWGCLGRSWARLGWTSGEALGTPWEALGTPWRIFLEDLGKTLEEPPGRAFRIHVDPQDSQPP